MRERANDMYAAADLDDDSRNVARRPVRKSFWSRLIHGHPREWLLVAGASFAVGAVVVNALFLQSGPHPAPIFANRAPASAGSAPAMMLPRPRPSGIKANLSMPNMPSMPAAPDPIAELLAPAQRVIALQRALADYGYGQIRPTGSYDPATRSAIEEFERSRKLPVTGRISNRVTRELAAMTGRPLE